MPSKFLLGLKASDMSWLMVYSRELQVNCGDAKFRKPFLKKMVEKGEQANKWMKSIDLNARRPRWKANPNGMLRLKYKVQVR